MVIEEVRLIHRDHESIVEAATTNALAAWPSLRESDAAVRATRDDLASTLKVTSSATLVGDTTIITDYVTWFETVLAARDLPLAFVSTAFTLLLEVLPPELPLTRNMARTGLTACTAAPIEPATPLTRSILES